MKRILVLIALLNAAAVVGQPPLTVYFDFDKSGLTAAARDQLDSFISSKKDKAGLSIQLHGYCDPIGSDGYNDRLSLQRVSAVRQYLLAKGIAAHTIITETGHGKKIQLNENTSAEERAVNRRVQLSYSFAVPENNTGPVSLQEQIADSATIAGTNLVLKNINFYGGRHQFLPSSKPMLEELLDVMRSNPKLVIRVEGHICCEPGPEDGLDADTNLPNLSEARAKAVRDYLVANNISGTRISYKGFGHAAPLYPYPEQSEEQQLENRRVEIKIITK